MISRQSGLQFLSPFQETRIVWEGATLSVEVPFLPCPMIALPAADDSRVNLPQDKQEPMSLWSRFLSDSSKTVFLELNAADVILAVIKRSLWKLRYKSIRNAASALSRRSAVVWYKDWTQETLSIQRYLVNSKEAPSHRQKQGETSFHSVYTKIWSNSYNRFTYTRHGLYGINFGLDAMLMHLKCSDVK